MAPSAEVLPPAGAAHSPLQPKQEAVPTPAPAQQNPRAATAPTPSSPEAATQGTPKTSPAGNAAAHVAGAPPRNVEEPAKGPLRVEASPFPTSDLKAQRGKLGWVVPLGCTAAVLMVPLLALSLAPNRDSPLLSPLLGLSHSGLSPLLALPSFKAALPALEAWLAHIYVAFLDAVSAASPLAVAACSCLLTLLASAAFFLRKRPIYLVSHACFKPSHGRNAFHARYDLGISNSRDSGHFDEPALEFQHKVFRVSGISEESCVPIRSIFLPHDPSIHNTRLEAKDVIFGCLDELFANTGVKPKQVGVLVVNCSLFVPTPSHCAMIINKYRMRQDILSYNLGGMGCSASPIAVGLAAEMLKQRPSSYAVVVSTELLTRSGYFGNVKSMLIPNCIFRMGGAAMLLSSRPSDWWRSKYELMYLVRTQINDDNSYQCVQQKEDPAGIVGVHLSRDLVSTASKALKSNMTTLGPNILPISEQLAFAVNFVARKVLNLKVSEYIPSFKNAVEHFCIHAGGRAVVDGIQKHLGLSSYQMEPARMTLWRFGNTSSSSIWYSLAYSEAKNRVRRGDRVWQLTFGSGFKCNSIVWRALRTIKFDKSKNSAWSDCIDSLPVDLSHLPYK